jgi:integrase
MPLTKRHIDSLVWRADGPGQQILYDNDENLPRGKEPPLGGFGVRVYPSGTKTFVLRYRPKGSGQVRYLVLGKYGALTVDQARALARAAHSAAASGADPAGDRRKERERERVGERVKDLCSLYLANHTKVRPNSRLEAERRIQKHIVPAFGARKVADLQRADVARLHRRLSERTPVEANRVIGLLRAMLNFARQEGMLPESAANPASGVRLNKEQSRDRWVQPEELPHLVAAIDAEAGANPYIAAVLRLYLLTGCRRNELLLLRWKDVDLKRGELYLRDSKNGDPRAVHLSPPAVAVLHDLPRELHGAYVFPGRVAGRPLVNINKTWHRVRARLWLAMNPEAADTLRQQAENEVAARSKHAEKSPAAVEQCLLALAAKRIPANEVVRLHDLRRTVGAMMATSGVPIEHIGKLLGHREGSTATRVYARIGAEAPRKALEQHGERMGAILGSGLQTNQGRR